MKLLTLKNKAKYESCVSWDRKENISTGLYAIKSPSELFRFQHVTNSNLYYLLICIKMLPYFQLSYFQNFLNQAEKTFILALDGDVDFEAEALQCLLDGMKINKNVGATCGRIIPGGSGILINIRL